MKSLFTTCHKHNLRRMKFAMMLNVHDDLDEAEECEDAAEDDAEDAAEEEEAAADSDADD